MRMITTPVFTSGRLKGMVSIMHKISVQLKEHTEKLSKDQKPVQTKKLFSQLAFEMIMSTGFGIDVNAWDDETNIFKKMANKYMGYDGNVFQMIKFILIFTLPTLMGKTY